MPVILTPPATGRLKRDLVEMMREFCGQAGFDFELTPDEVGSDLRLLDTMMAEHPFNLMGYSVTSPSLAEDPSGILDIDVQAVVSNLAIRRAGGTGSSLSGEARATASATWTSACSRYATVPTALIAPNTPRGSGRSWWRRSPFITETS